MTGRRAGENLTDFPWPDTLIVRRGEVWLTEVENKYFPVSSCRDVRPDDGETCLMPTLWIICISSFRRLLARWRTVWSDLVKNWMKETASISRSFLRHLKVDWPQSGNYEGLCPKMRSDSECSVNQDCFCRAWRDQDLCQPHSCGGGQLDWPLCITQEAVTSDNVCDGYILTYIHSPLRKKLVKWLYEVDVATGNWKINQLWKL